MKTVSDHRTILQELAQLVQNTFSLWCEHWVGFSWRNYYFNHTQRVQALCRTLGMKEGADLLALDFAAILHDITKRYDGEIILDSQGQRVVDANGFWHNELLLPQNENIVTSLYRQYNLFHTLHNHSGAIVAQHLLATYDLDPTFCHFVCTIIESHLKPDHESEKEEHYLEKQILYEADTLDSNIGLTAFYRNIQIRTHHAITQDGHADLSKYIPTIESWISRKRGFMEKIVTTTGVALAESRLQRMKVFYSQILDDYNNHFEASRRYGLLGIMQYFMDHNTDPNLTTELTYLRSHWLPTRYKQLQQEHDPSSDLLSPHPSPFCHLLHQEVTGQL
jgi:HD superfamily phosphodiesterase